MRRSRGERGVKYDGRGAGIEVVETEVPLSQPCELMTPGTLSPEQTPTPGPYQCDRNGRAGGAGEYDSEYTHHTSRITATTLFY